MKQKWFFGVYTRINKSLFQKADLLVRPLVGVFLFISVIGGVFIPITVQAQSNPCDSIASEVQRTACLANQTTSDCLTAAGTSEVRRNACLATGTTGSPDTTTSTGNTSPVSQCSSMTDPQGRAYCLQLENARATGAAPPSTPPDGCSNIITTFTDCIDSGFAWIINHTLLAVAGWFLWVTATVMNYSIDVGILQFAKWAPDTLYPIWLIIRQIVSLFVVFAGLWLGFMYIINKGDQFKKYIPWVVIFALFVNFSYPITRTVIDISNIISLNLYASAVGSDALTASTISVSDDKTAGAIIRDRLGLTGLVNFATGDTTGAAGSLNKINSTPVALLAVIFISYAAWIFFLVAALIITRTAVLVFLIVASPILFVDAIIPKLGEQAADLRKIFFEQLFVGPVFTIMLALTLKFLEIFQTGGALTKAGIGTTGVDSTAMFFNLLMMLIMLHIMLKVTKATSGKIGQAVSGVMGKVGGFAVGGVALGGAGLLGRATIGRGAAAIRDSKWMGGLQEKTGIAGFAGKHLFNASNSVATSGFDARNSAFVRTNAEKIGMKLSTGNSMGFEARAEERSKNLESRLGRIGTHKKNTYETDPVTGKMVIKNRKGDIDSSPEAEASRERFIKNNSSSVFSSKQENQDAQFKLQEINTNQKKTQNNQAISEISTLNKDKPEDRAKIDALFAKYGTDVDMTRKLKEAFKKKIADDYASLDGDIDRKERFIKTLNSSATGTPEKEIVTRLLNNDAQKALTEYKNTPGDIAKTQYLNAQTDEVKRVINEYERKEAIKTAEKTTAQAESAAQTAALERSAQATVDLLAHLTGVPTP